MEGEEKVLMSKKAGPGKVAAHGGMGGGGLLRSGVSLSYLFVGIVLQQFP